MDDLRRLLQRLVRAGGLLEPHSGHEHAGVRFSMSEMFALGELDEHGALTQQDLGARMGLEKSTVSRLAAAMETRGWLRRDRDPANRRFYRLSLTEDGQAVARRVGDDLRTQHGSILALMTPDERQSLMMGLSGLVRALDAVSPLRR